MRLGDSSASVVHSSQEESLDSSQDAGLPLTGPDVESLVPGYANSSMLESLAKDYDNMLTHTGPECAVSGSSCSTPAKSASGSTCRPVCFDSPISAQSLNFPLPAGVANSSLSTPIRPLTTPSLFESPTLCTIADQLDSPCSRLATVGKSFPPDACRVPCETGFQVKKKHISLLAATFTSPNGRTHEMFREVNIVSSPSMHCKYKMAQKMSSGKNILAQAVRKRCKYNAGDKPAATPKTAKKLRAKYGNGGIVAVIRSRKINFAHEEKDLSLIHI